MYAKTSMYRRNRGFSVQKFQTIRDIKGLHVFCIRNISSVGVSSVSDTKVIYAFCTLILGGTKINRRIKVPRLHEPLFVCGHEMHKSSFCIK